MPPRGGECSWALCYAATCGPATGTVVETQLRRLELEAVTTAPLTDGSDKLPIGPLPIQQGTAGCGLEVLGPAFLRAGNLRARPEQDAHLTRRNRGGLRKPVQIIEKWPVGVDHQRVQVVIRHAQRPTNPTTTSEDVVGVGQQPHSSTWAISCSVSRAAAIVNQVGDSFRSPWCSSSSAAR